MKYLLLIFLLSSCSSIIKNNYKASECGNTLCKYEDRSDYMALYIELYIPKKAEKSLVLLKREGGLCLIGTYEEKDFASKKEIMKVSRLVGADFVYHYKVFSDKVNILGDTTKLSRDFINKYTYLENDYSMVYFYVSKKRAINCYDITNE